MTFSLLSELLETTHGRQTSKQNWKIEALEFQQLMLDNPWIENLDVSIEHFEDQYGEHYDVHVKHAEFMDITFHIDDHFSISHSEADENYGDTAKEAYENAMPILIGIKAGFALKGKRAGESSTFDNFEINVDHNTSHLRMLNDHSDELDAVFAWNAKQQGYEPVDDENLPKGHGMLFKTIQSMADYLGSFSR